MREYELPIPTGEGRLPDEVRTWPGGDLISNYIIPPATTVNCTYYTTHTKCLIANDSDGDVYIRLGGNCQATNYMLRLRPRDYCVIGQDRPHLFTQLSLYSTAQLCYHGQSKNFTIEAWV